MDTLTRLRQVRWDVVAEAGRLDTAELVAFLASPAGHWVNGQVIRVNGGIV